MKKALAFSLIAASAAFSSCGESAEVGSAVQPYPAVELKTENDSLSYAVGVVFSPGMYPLMQERGFADGLEECFVRGLRDAFAVDENPEALAYTSGVRLAGKVGTFLEYEKKFSGIDVESIDRPACLAALLEMAREGLDPDKVLSAKQCIEESGSFSTAEVSYAAGVLLFMEYSHSAQGLDPAQTSVFVKGIKDAFPLEKTPETSAYISGVTAAVEAEALLDDHEFSLFGDDGINRRAYLDAVVASAMGENGEEEIRAAAETFNTALFRRPGERFFRNNKGRRGVHELPSGLQYKVTELGSGVAAKEGDTVHCTYKCTLTNGNVVSTTRGKAVPLKVADQVPGLKEALMTLPAGTKCMLYVPWHLGYGSSDQGGVPAYSALVYDLEIGGPVQ